MDERWKSWEAGVDIELSRAEGTGRSVGEERRSEGAADEGSICSVRQETCHLITTPPANRWRQALRTDHGSGVNAG